MMETQGDVKYWRRWRRWIKNNHPEVPSHPGCSLISHISTYRSFRRAPKSPWSKVKTTFQDVSSIFKFQATPTSIPTSISFREIFHSVPLKGDQGDLAPKAGDTRGEFPARCRWATSRKLLSFWICPWRTVFRKGKHMEKTWTNTRNN